MAEVRALGWDAKGTVGVAQDGRGSWADRAAAGEEPAEGIAVCWQGWFGAGAAVQADLRLYAAMIVKDS